MRRTVLASIVLVTVGVGTGMAAAQAGSDIFLPLAGAGLGGAPSGHVTVFVHNPGSVPANVTFYLLERRATLAPLTFSDTIQPKATASYENPAELMFGTRAAGALRLTSNVRVMAGLRTAAGTDEPNRPAGAFVAGMPASFAIGSGEATELLGVPGVVAGSEATVRYGYSLVETTGTGTCEVRVTPRDALGTELGSATRTVLQWEQAEGTVEVVASGRPLHEARLEVEVTAGTGRVIVLGAGAVNSRQRPSAGDAARGDEAGAPADDLMAELTLPYLGVLASLDDVAFKVVNTGYAIMGEASDTSAAGVAGRFTSTGNEGMLGIWNAGVFGRSDVPGGSGVDGYSETGYGVSGRSMQAVGVRAYSLYQSALEAGSGSPGLTKATVRASNGATNGVAVLGATGKGNGVIGTSSGTGYAAVYGRNDAGYGIYGLTAASCCSAAYGKNALYNTVGQLGNPTAGVYGAKGSSGTTFAGYFSGDVLVTGSVYKQGGAFRIDHPQDPANRFLSHSFVESPDMLNIYNGTVVTDERGRAVVELPSYFESLNRDFRYQLTVIGRFAQAIVEEEIACNRFVIRTNLANVKVSWLVTGVRKDRWAEAHRVSVEEDKPEAERGFYLAPELWGRPEERSLELASSPERATQTRDPRPLGTSEPQ